MNTAVKERNIEKILNGNFQYFFVAIIMAIVAAFLLGSKLPIDPLLVTSVLTIGILFLFKIIAKSIKLPLIPSMILQLIVITMFFDRNITSLTGISLKLYAVVFAMGTIVAFFCIMKNFKSLWKDFPMFRGLFLFFVLNVIYSICYHSDFRVWFSDYLNILFYGKASVARFYSILNGESGIAQEFTESGLGIYLFGLVPIVSATLSLMAFKGINLLDQAKERLNNVIKYTSLAFAGHFVLIALTFAVGLNTLLYGEQGRLDAGFLGIAGEADLFMAFFLITFIGYLFISNLNDDNKNLKLTNIVIPTILIILLSIILLSINKTCIISLGSSLLLFFILAIRSGASPSKFTYKNPIFIVVCLVSFAILISLVMTNPTFMDSITKRFSTAQSLVTRGNMWSAFIDDWLYNMNFFTFIFGNGIDSSRELAFKVSSMIGENNGGIAQPHIHNMFLQMFYEYGLLAFLYFGALISIAVKNIKNLWLSSSYKEVKLLSILSLTLIMFFTLYHMSYVIRIPGQIIFFSLLGFIESAKYSLIAIKPNLNLD